MHTHTHLEAAGMDDLVADGALHQGQAELLLLRVHRVLLPRLTAGETHRCVGQHGLQTHTQKNKYILIHIFYKSLTAAKRPNST